MSPDFDVSYQVSKYELLQFHEILKFHLPKFWVLTSVSKQRILLIEMDPATQFQNSFLLFYSTMN